MSRQVSDNTKKRKHAAEAVIPGVSKKQKSNAHEAAQDDFTRSKDFVPLSDAMPQSSTATDATASGGSKRKSNSQKRRLIKRAEARGEELPVFKNTNSVDEVVDEAEDDAGSAPGHGRPTSRFIVFIGNLPFTATVDSVKNHFKSIEPDAIRLPMQEDAQQLKRKSDEETDSGKSSGKAKGFAFLEFQSYDRLKTCLKLYHHTLFDDGKSRGRKINVELTAGGGGASSDRKAKIKEKNEKLRDERRRRAVENAKQAKQGNEKDKNGKLGHPPPTAAKDTDSLVVGSSIDGLHPARRALIERRR